MSRPRQAKRVQSSKKIERRGIALISGVVADMGHLWNEPQNDFGTDGYIELVDPTTDKATNRIVLVQSKATSVSFGERPIGFTCDEDDLRYWLHGNAPIILVRSDTTSGEAYWVSVKDYFREHPEQRASRRIQFDREKDRFEPRVSDQLFALARPRVDGLYLGTPPFRENLISNLLPVEAFPATIFSGTAVAATHREAMRAFEGLPGQWPRGWILWSGRVYTFTNLASSPIARLFAKDVVQESSDRWAYSQNEDERHRFVWLLKAALAEQARPALRTSRDLMWVEAPAELPLEIPVPGTSQSRTLVKRYEKPDGDTRYVRHLAFEPRFALFAEQWYLEITPTYHFTRDGRVPDQFAAEHRSGIKRIERFSDFRRNVDSLTMILRGEVDLGGLEPDDSAYQLEFGSLEKVMLDTGADDFEDRRPDEDEADEDEHDEADA